MAVLGDWIKLVIDFLARVPGLPVLIGLVLIVINFVLQLLPAWPVVGWMAQVNLLLHIGLVISVVGLLIIRTL